MQKSLKTLNLANLRDITRGNINTEKMLFEAFLTVFTKAIDNLGSHLEKKQEIIWREQAHFLKGSAGNIGAERLADFCEQAEKNYRMEKKEKEKLFKDMKEEFDKVREALTKT